LNINGGFMDAVNGSLQAIVLRLGASIYFSVPVSK
jgi:hypothetical protein